jgi:hypothetical protein
MSQLTGEINTDRLTLKNESVSGISQGWQKEPTKYYMLFVLTFSVTCLVCVCSYVLSHGFHC